MANQPPGGPYTTTTTNTNEVDTVTVEANNQITRGEGEDSFFNNRDIRPEERWHLSLSHLAEKFRDQAAAASELHDRAGYSARMKHRIFAIPAPVIALLVASISGMWIEDCDGDNTSRFVIIPLSTIGAIFATVHTVLNMGGRAEQFWRYAALYGALVVRIDRELARDPEWRTPADAFFAEIGTAMTNLNATAPQLPGKGCCGCSKYKGVPPIPTVTTQTGDSMYDHSAANRV